MRAAQAMFQGNSEAREVERCTATEELEVPATAVEKVPQLGTRNFSVDKKKALKEANFGTKTGYILAKETARISVAEAENVAHPLSVALTVQKTSITSYVNSLTVVDNGTAGRYASRKIAGRIITGRLDDGGTDVITTEDIKEAAFLAALQAHT